MVSKGRWSENLKILNSHDITLVISWLNTLSNKLIIKYLRK